MPVGVVLTGGRSSRMGTDKATLAVLGVPMAARVTAAMERAGCQPVWCQGGDADALAAIGLTVRPDRALHEGPLAAIIDALAACERQPAAGDDLVVIAACDLPGIDADVIATLLAAAGDAPEAHAVVAAGSDGAAHLLGVWRPTAIARLAAIVADGSRSYRSALAALGAVVVAIDDTRLRNVNTRSDLVDAERGIRPVASPPVAVSEISVDQLSELLADGARLIDVREPAEFAEARVPGAVLVPLATVPDNVAMFAGDEPVYVICRSGGRSLHACEFLSTRGIDAVNVAGGTLAWVSSGRPYDSGVV